MNKIFDSHLVVGHKNSKNEYERTVIAPLREKSNDQWYVTGHNDPLEEDEYVTKIDLEKMEDIDFEISYGIKLNTLPHYITYIAI